LGSDFKAHINSKALNLSPELLALFQCRLAVLSCWPVRSSPPELCFLILIFQIQVRNALGSHSHSRCVWGSHVQEKNVNYEQEGSQRKRNAVRRKLKYF